MVHLSHLSLSFRRDQSQLQSAMKIAANLNSLIHSRVSRTWNAGEDTPVNSTRIRAPVRNPRHDRQLGGRGYTSCGLG